MPFSKHTEYSSTSVVIKYQVRGFRNVGCVTVMQCRRLGSGEWLPPTIHRSAGGHSDDYSFECERDFACALSDAVEECRKLARKSGTTQPQDSQGNSE